MHDRQPATAIRTAGLLVSAFIALSPMPSVAAQGAVPAHEEIHTIVSGQQTITPGYAVGNVSLADPKIADFRVLPGRREVLVLGRGAGRTTLVLWDQQSAKRGEYDIVVRTQKQLDLERDLKELLRPFPETELRVVGDTLTMIGTVNSAEDLTSIDKIASTFGVKSLVRRTAPTPAPVESLRGSIASSAGTASTGARVVYEVELFEASSLFKSGSYATGVEPSGRSLFKGTVTAGLDGEERIFIGGAAVRADEKSPESGIRLTLRPQSPDTKGRFATHVFVETNLPFDGSTYDPNTWRRARWQFMASSGEPFGITGSDLLATPQLASGGSSRKRNATRLATQAGISRATRSVSAAEAVPILGSLFSSPSYKQNRTQLLVVLRPRLE